MCVCVLTLFPVLRQVLMANHQRHCASLYLPARGKENIDGKVPQDVKAGTVALGKTKMECVKETGVTIKAKTSELCVCVLTLFPVLRQLPARPITVHGGYTVGSVQSAMAHQLFTSTAGNIALGKCVTPGQPDQRECGMPG